MKNIKFYEKNILLFNDKNILMKYQVMNDCREYNKKYKDCTLTISVNTNSHIIENAQFTMPNQDKYINGVMNAFLSVIIGLPILEAQDHSVLRLESLLHDNSKQHLIKGLLMPTNACELFNTPLFLIRKLYKQYEKDNGYNPFINTYQVVEIKEWRETSLNDKEKLLNQKIENFCIQNNIMEYEFKLISDTRIEFFVDKNLYPFLSTLLFNMEKYLCEEFKFSLEVMFVAKKDANRKRKVKV